MLAMPLRSVIVSLSTQIMSDRNTNQAPVRNSHQYTPKIESTFYTQAKQFDT